MKNQRSRDHRSGGGSWRRLLVVQLLCAACGTPAEFGSLDPRILSELRTISDILSRPHEFPDGPASGRGSSASDHPIDYGCALPEHFLPDAHWMHEGLTIGTKDVLAFDPEDASRPPRAEVPWACWRLEQLGCAGLLRGSLAAVQDDSTLSSAARCQATRTIGAIGDTAAAVKLAGVVGDEVVGPEALRSLSRMGHTALEGVRRAGLPQEARARSRITWLFGRRAEDLNATELDWLVSGLAGAQHPEAIWALLRLHERRPEALVKIIRPLLTLPEPDVNVWALLACALVRDSHLEAIALAMAREGAAAPRQLALHYLGRIETPDAVSILSDLLRDPAAAPGDRAAAMLGLSFHRAGRSRFFSDLEILLGSDDLKLVRAALRSLWDVPEVPDVLVARAKELIGSKDYDVRYLARFVGVKQ